MSVLRPNLLKLNTASERSPAGLFDVPNRPIDLMHKIKEVYELWYRIWCNEYIPIISQRQKWFKDEEDLKESDIVYFKLTDSPFSPSWQVGKVEYTIVSKDKKVRTVGVSYKHDTESGKKEFRIVERPVRQMIKLMNIEDTTLIEDIRKVHESAKRKIREQKLVNAGFFDDYYDESHDGNLFDANFHKNSIARRFIFNSYIVRKHPIQSTVYLIEEKFGYEVKVPEKAPTLSEKLTPTNNDAVHDWEKMFFNVDDENADPDADITEIVLL